MTDLPIAEVGGEDLAPISAPLGSRTRSRGSRVKDALMAYLFLLPALVVFAVFAYYPLYKLFFDSVHRQPRFLNKPPTYVGFDQLKDTLTGSEFSSGLWHSATFMLYAVPLGLVLGVLLAVSRAPPPQGHQGLPDHLLVDGGVLGGRRRGRVLHPGQPRGRLLQGRPVAQPDRSHVGHVRRVALVGVAEPRAHVHHRAGRAASGPGRAQRGCDPGRVRTGQTLLPHHRAAHLAGPALPGHRPGGQCAAGLRPDRDPDRGRAGRGHRDPALQDRQTPRASDRSSCGPACRSACSS